jgi:integrase
MYRAEHETRAIKKFENHLALRRDDLRKVAPQALPVVSPDTFTLKRAFTEAWKPAKKRSAGTLRETERFVDAFIALNGALALTEYTRDHWAKWRADCIAKHGPEWTGFKRFTMVKTVVAEAIRAGLLERKHFAGQDVTMRKPARSNLRNEGWSDDELKDLFESEVFKHREGKHWDAEYWVPVIIALTGARRSEVVGMNVADVGQRHGVQTFYLARQHGKTEASRRIIPVPDKLVQLGLLDYIQTLDPKGPLFPTTSSVNIGNWFGRYRKSIGVDRKGCDLHAFRHHMVTMLTSVGTGTRTSQYITGHAPVSEGAKYGKDLLVTALQSMNKVDLGVTIPPWKA